MSQCEAIRERLMDSARGRHVDPALREQVRDHVRDCADCARRLENERALSAGLAMLSVAHMSVPPLAVKQALMADFRRANRVTPMRRPAIRWVAIAAAAAAVVAGVWMTRPIPRTKVASVPPAPLSVPAAPEPAVNEPVVVAAKPKVVRRRRNVQAKPQAKEQSSEPPPKDQPEVATEFYTIPYTEPLRPEERADIFRIEMPRANISAFGLPLSGGRLDAPVTADVLVGEDGVMRAVRFVR